MNASTVLVGVEDGEEVERLLLAHSPKLRAILEAADRVRKLNGSGKKQRSNCGN